jgi:hypothetical protein
MESIEEEGLIFVIVVIPNTIIANIIIISNMNVLADKINVSVELVI